MSKTYSQTAVSTFDRGIVSKNNMFVFETIPRLKLPTIDVTDDIDTTSTNIDFNCCSVIAVPLRHIMQPSRQPPSLFGFRPWTTMSSSSNGRPASSRSDGPAPYNSSIPAIPSDRPPGQYFSKRKRPAEAPATNNQRFGNNVVNANERRYAHPTIYPMNRPIPVDPNISGAQFMVAILMF